MRVMTSLAASAALIALVLSVYALGRPGEVGGESLARLESALGEVQRKIDYVARAIESELEVARDIQGRIAGLERESALSGDGSGAAGDASGAGEEPVREVVRVLVEKLDALGGKLEEVDQVVRTSRVVPSVAGPMVVETAEERQAAVEESQAVAADRSRGLEERLQALRNLRFRDGRSREVTLAMIELIQDPELPPRARADIIRQLDEVNFPELKEPLIHAALNDAQAEVRSEAIETLEPFLDDPRVVETLRQVKENDADFRVRLEAAERLERFERGFAER